MAGKAGFTREGDPMGRFFVGPAKTYTNSAI